MAQNASRWLVAATALLTLPACEMRRDTAEQETPPTPVQSVSASPAASIIREDIAEPDDLEVPTQAVELTLGFPDGADINAASERALAGLMQSDAVRSENWPIIISGHTDSAGADQANLRTSRARAEAVAAWLVERGVADGRIQVVAFGEQNPVAPNALPDGSVNEAGRRTNRRVEIRIAPPTGEQPTDTQENDEQTGDDDA